MKVDLDTHELFYLLDNCLRGSHIRSGTIERFVDDWFIDMSEHQRMSIFEWAVRISYAWNGHGYFEPQSSCCEKDVIFMKRFHPNNQYMVTLVDETKKPVTVRAFRMNDRYYVNCSRICGEEFITKVEHLYFSEWEKYKQRGVDYDKNIIV